MISTCVFGGHFRQPGKTDVWDGWERRLVNWAGARLVMTLDKIAAMTVAAVREGCCP